MKRTVDTSRSQSLPQIQVLNEGDVKLSTQHGSEGELDVECQFHHGNTIKVNVTSTSSVNPLIHRVHSTSALRIPRQRNSFWAR